MYWNYALIGLRIYKYVYIYIICSRFIQNIQKRTLENSSEILNTFYKLKKFFYNNNRKYFCNINIISRP